MRATYPDKAFYKSLVLLAVPMILQNLISFAVGFADNLMVSSLGDSAVSGVYLANQMQTLLRLFSGGIEGAIAILAAQYWGKGDRKSIRLLLSIGLHFALLFTLALTLCAFLFPEPILSVFTADSEVIREGAKYLRIVCFSYAFFCSTQVMIAAMRSLESTAIGMTVSLISLAANIVLNNILIFGRLGFPALGIRGAALATLISRMLETLVISIYVFRADRKLRFRPRDLFLTDRTLKRDLMRCGIPVTVHRMVWSVNVMAASAMLGRFPAHVVTAVSVADSLYSMMVIALFALASAVGIITGKMIGAGKTEVVRLYTRPLQRIFLLISILTAVLGLVLRRPFVSLYRGITPEAASTALQFTAIISVTAAGSCYHSLGFDGLISAGGDVRFILRVDLIFVFLIILPSAVLAMLLNAPAWVVFTLLKWDQVLKCFVSDWKIRKSDWLYNLTR